MFSAALPTTGRLLALGASAAALVSLSACSSSDPLDTAEQNDGPVVIGSQDYYSNEIIAEIYAQALEEAGFEVSREFRIGQREVYLPEVEAGKIDIFPEYSGNILQYWEPDTPARLSEDVYDALVAAAPAGIKVLDQAPATDQDTYTVTADFAERWQLTTLNDLVRVSDELVVGGNSELESRPYGPEGLKQMYGVDTSFTPIEDSGGPLTVKALVDGSINLANIYSADPAIARNNLVSLRDTTGLFLASHVVPIVSDDLDPEAIAVLNEISADLSERTLRELNEQSVSEQLSAAVIAQRWLASR